MMVLRWTALAVALSSTAAAAETAPAQKPAENERGGFVLGLTGGFAMGTASGYPNDLQKLDNPTFHSDGGFMVGESSGFMMMGAFARELNFGIWLNQSFTSSSAGKSNAYGGGFRVEVFPIGWLVPALRDLVFIGQFGIGGGNLTGAAPEAAEGVQSYVGAGAFYEWMFAHPGKTRWVVGPSVEYQLVTSRPFDRPNVVFGLRFALYTGR